MFTCCHMWSVHIKVHSLVDIILIWLSWFVNGQVSLVYMGAKWDLNIVIEDLFMNIMVSSDFNILVTTFIYSFAKLLSAWGPFMSRQVILLKCCSELFALRWFLACLLPDAWCNWKHTWLSSCCSVISVLYFLLRRTCNSSG